MEPPSAGAGSDEWPIGLAREIRPQTQPGSSAGVLYSASRAVPSPARRASQRSALADVRGRRYQC